MDRLFLDANVLFSAAYRLNSGLLRLWKLSNARLCTSRYAVEEARANLEEEVQQQRLIELCQVLELVDATHQTIPAEISLPEKDKPILLAAMSGRATHLLTGDFRHFGQYFGKTIHGLLVLTPGEYLRRYAEK